MWEEIQSISHADMDIRSFSRIVGGVLLLAGIVSFFSGGYYYTAFFLGGGALQLFGEIAPRGLRMTYWLWMAGAILLGWVVTRVILIVVFFGIVTPLRAIARVFGKKFLESDEPTLPGSYWHKREGPAARASYEQQF